MICLRLDFFLICLVSFQFEVSYQFTVGNTEIKIVTFAFAFISPSNTWTIRFLAILHAQFTIVSVTAIRKESKNYCWEMKNYPFYKLCTFFRQIHIRVGKFLDKLDKLLDPWLDHCLGIWIHIDRHGFFQLMFFVYMQFLWERIDLHEFYLKIDAKF